MSRGHPRSRLSFEHVGYRAATTKGTNERPRLGTESRQDAPPKKRPGISPTFEGAPLADERGQTSGTQQVCQERKLGVKEAVASKTIQGHPATPGGDCSGKRASLRFVWVSERVRPARRAENNVRQQCDRLHVDPGRTPAALRQHCADHLV